MAWCNNFKNYLSQAIPNFDCSLELAQTYPPYLALAERSDSTHTCIRLGI